MKRFHIALSTNNLEATLSDYTARLGMPPCLVIRSEYALWRTESLNLSVRYDSSSAETLRHLGWEDPAAVDFTQDVDVNGIIWERFSAEVQAREISDIWPHSTYRLND